MEQGDAECRACTAVRVGELSIVVGAEQNCAIRGKRERQQTWFAVYR